jgi:hypothetical protein
MRTISASDVVRLWELGAGKSSFEMALTSLAFLFPEMNRDEILDLPLGKCNTLLAKVREALFGPMLAGFSECPHCPTAVEFTFDMSRHFTQSEPASFEGTLSVEGYEIRYRALTLRDIILAAQCEPGKVRSFLARRAVQAIEQAGRAAEFDNLPEFAPALLAEEMTRCDPQAEAVFDLLCPSCHGRWQAQLEMVEFLTPEIHALARRLLREVHGLARAYGWRESAILGMSARRREYYLQMVNA